MHRLFVWTIALLVPELVFAQRTITQLIDSTAGLNRPEGIAVDSVGNVYVSGTGTSAVYRIAPDGTVTSVVGTNAIIAGHRIQSANDVIVDRSGNLIIAANQQVVVMIEPDGSQSVVVDIEGDYTTPCCLHGISALECPLVTPQDCQCVQGQCCDECTQPSCSFSQDCVDAGVCDCRRFPCSLQDCQRLPPELGIETHLLGVPIALELGPSGEIFVASRSFDAVFKISPDGAVRTVIDESGDGMGNALRGVFDIDVDSSGNLYVLGEISDNVFRVAPDGAIIQLIDSSGDGSSTTFFGGRAVAVDAQRNVYAGPGSDHSLLRVSPNGTVTKLFDRLLKDENGRLLRFSVADLHADSVGNVYVGAEVGVFRINPSGSIESIMDQQGDGMGNAIAFASALVTDSVGNVYASGLTSNNAFKISGCPGGDNRIDVNRDGISDACTPINYVALGDSYSSGEGVPPYEPESDRSSPFFPKNLCHRSLHAYNSQVRAVGASESIEELVAAGEAGFSLDFVACSGAQTIHVKDQGFLDYAGTPDGDSSQLDRAVDMDTDLVTITISGNDAMFSAVIKFCTSDPPDCHLQPFGSSPTLEIFLSGLIGGPVRDALRSTYERIKLEAPSAAIVVAGYPLLLSGTPCLSALGLNPDELTFLRRMGVQLNQVILEVAQETGVHFVSVESRFDGHLVCDPEPWIHGVRIPLVSSYHPTRRGQAAYAEAINGYLRRISLRGWPHGFLASGLPANPSPAGTPAPIAGPTVVAQGAGMAFPLFDNLTVERLGPSFCADESVYVPGDAIRISGEGFAPGELVALTYASPGFDLQVQIFHSDPDGEVAFDFFLPADVPVPSLATLKVEGSIGAGGGGTVLLSDFLRVSASSTEDGDKDGIPDTCDNCPGSLTLGSDQTDTDQDGMGDICDPCPMEMIDDEDGDGLCASVDPFPLDPDNDLDEDGVSGVRDNCPAIGNPDQRNVDALPAGDACQCGDVTGEGNLDVVDRAMIARYIAGFVVPSSFLGSRCSVVAPDDSCDAEDDAAVREYLANLVFPLSNACLGAAP